MIGVAHLHRMIRRSTSYGPMLPDVVLEDDGADRGIIFVAGGARLDRQFELVKPQWIKQGPIFASPDEKDPLQRWQRRVHHPPKPIRRLHDGTCPPSWSTAAAKYCFIPSLSARPSPTGFGRFPGVVISHG
jgi:hypothetical protein